MSIKLLSSDWKSIPLQRIQFPAGESFHRLPADIEHILDPDLHGKLAQVVIEFNYENNGEFVELAMLVDALRRVERVGISLIMPYIPYARQDRVCNPGEPLSVAVVASLINAMNFEYVAVMDPHSDVASALIKEVRIVDQHEFLSENTEVFDREKTVLIAPDAGALKKVYKAASALGFKHVLTASKKRDLSNGQITDTELFVPEQYRSGYKFLVLDDICDGGRTFVELGKVLKAQIDPSSEVLLYVTHGIFTKGYDELKKYYNRIYSANLMAKDDGEGYVSHPDGSLSND